MEKVNAVKLNSANVKYDNLVDAERMYDIEANANLSNGKVVSMDAGVVRKDDVMVASFSVYGDHQMNINYMGVDSVSDKCNILMAIDTFVTEVENEIEVNPINL